MKILTNRNFKNLTDTLSVFKNKIKELSDEAEIKDAKIESMQKTYISMQKVKDREITRLQNEISNAKEKNQNQLNTIKELTKKIDYKSIEYKNNGLPKQSKKAFKKGNK